MPEESLASLLGRLGLQSHLPLFVDEELDVALLKTMGVHLKQSLVDLGLSVGDAERLVAALTIDANPAEDDDDELLIEDNPGSDDDGGGLQPEENPESDDDGLALEDNAGGSGEDDEDDGLALEENAGDSDSDGLALEDNGAAEGSDDGDDDGLALEDNGGGGAGGDAEPFHRGPSVSELKEAGNQAFREGRLHDAHDSYSQALAASSSASIGATTNAERATLLANRAACGLKLCDWAGAINDCTASLSYADAAFSPFDAFLVKHVGAFGMSMAHGKIKQKYGIDDERAALMEKLAVWDAELGDRDFRGGDAPDLGDVTVFGDLGAVGGLPAREDVVRDSPKVAAWLARVDAALPPPVVVEG